MPERPYAVLKYEQELEKRAATGEPGMGLLPWELALAEWKAGQPKRPPLRETLAMCERLAGEPITATHYYRVVGKPEWRAARNRFAKHAMRKARKQFKQAAPYLVDAHIKGLQMAMKAEDHRSIPSYTVPALDRIVPKRQEGVANVQVLNVTLSVAQQALLEKPEAIDVEYEVIPNETPAT